MVKVDTWIRGRPALADFAKLPITTSEPILQILDFCSNETIFSVREIASGTDGPY